MIPRLLAIIGAAILGLSAAAGTAWWLRANPEPVSIAAPEPASLPVPPFPPRLAGGEQYDKCLTMVEEDADGAEAFAAAWKTAGGGDPATHCQALAAIAGGEPETGAETLETLARSGQIPALMRAVLLSQAAEARLQADQPEDALKDASEALEISPEDTDLLIARATAHDALSHQTEALEDLNQALLLDERRADALVLRASIWRRMDMLAEAKSDIDKAAALDPDDAEILVERGLVRQRLGDGEGARKDWLRAREIDPNSDTAELAARNLTLLDAGPEKK